MENIEITVKNNDLGLIAFKIAEFAKTAEKFGVEAPTFRVVNTFEKLGTAVVEFSFPAVAKLGEIEDSRCFTVSAEDLWKKKPAPDPKPRPKPRPKPIATPSELRSFIRTVRNSAEHGELDRKVANFLEKYLDQKAKAGSASKGVSRRRPNIKPTSKLSRSALYKRARAIRAELDDLYLENGKLAGRKMDLSRKLDDLGVARDRADNETDYRQAESDLEKARETWETVVAEIAEIEQKIAELRRDEIEIKKALEKQT